MGQQSKAKAARRAARQELWSPVTDRDDIHRVRAFIAGRRSGKRLLTERMAELERDFNIAGRIQETVKEL